MSPKKPGPPLSPLEHQVMAHVWKRGRVTADELLKALDRPLKNATVRTILRRLEAKGYLRHSVDGRAFVYEARVERGAAATGAIRRVMQRFFGGSPSRLLAGLIDEGLIGLEDVKALSRQSTRRPAAGRTGR
jgi:BlaI family transcriptional regulator, penicillinase repressor